MKREDAYTIHDRALQYLRETVEVAKIEAFDAGAPEEAAEMPQIAISVQDFDTGTSRVALRVLTLDERTRRQIEEMRERGMIPGDTEVEEIGPVWAFGPQDPVSPVQPGVACAHSAGSRGTVGCLVRRGADLLILSANHVLARENRAPLGSDIVQPSNGSIGRRVVAELTAFEPLRATGNEIDGAVARLVIGDVDPTLFNNVRVTSVRTAPLVQGDRLFKFGQATEEREGTYHEMTSNQAIPMRFGTYSFDRQIVVKASGPRAFSCGGDSGALVYDQQQRAVGIVIGGNCIDRTFVTPIEPLLTKLGVTLA